MTNTWLRHSGARFREDAVGLAMAMTASGTSLWVHGHDQFNQSELLRYKSLASPGNSHLHSADGQSHSVKHVNV